MTVKIHNIVLQERKDPFEGHEDEEEIKIDMFKVKVRVHLI